MLVQAILFTAIFILDVLGQWQLNQIHKRCQQPFKPSPIAQVYPSKFISTALVNSPENDNLIEQMVHNPCMQIKFTGSIMQKSTHIVVYGTCNLGRMFRFVLEHSIAEKCWNMELRVWDPAKNSSESCNDLPLANAYTIHWSMLLGSEIQLGSTNESLIENFKRFTVWLWYAELNEMGWRAIPDHAEKFNQTMLHFVDRSECSCCRGNLSNTIDRLHYENTCNAHCGHMEHVPAKVQQLDFEMISSLNMAVVLNVMILAMMSRL